MDSEQLSQRFWEPFPHSKLPGFGTGAKTTGDIQALERFLKPTDRVLDLGCGWGRLTLALAREGYHVTGIDLSENLINYARQQSTETGLNVCFDVGSMLDLPYPDTSFDKIICMWGVFNHLLTVADQVTAMNEMYRVLATGGAAFIEMSNGESKRYRHIRETEAYGPGNRIWNMQYDDGTPPNVLYLHDKQTLAGAAKQSYFEKYKVKFQNINHRRRTVTLLYK
jgi:ubiquinone/menaquinone biosynthesis C-methylase UbiE